MIQFEESRRLARSSIQSLCGKDYLHTITARRARAAVTGSVGGCAQVGCQRINDPSERQRVAVCDSARLRPNSAQLVALRFIVCPALNNR